ncbi:ORF 75 [Macacine gammaherpesvirus 5]|uniref:Tegument prot/FGARAT n=1 Tax=Rhesus monkey rhadinovirus H26-95 TaxID=69256 RepID=Q9J2G9_9GAMA|nr:tegument prot/FGARAT [Rhesus monkey rhadinovirus H26-95]QFN51694.1 ORF 75 [Macacine gammaherpesvirus 5]
MAQRTNPRWAAAALSPEEEAFIHDNSDAESVLALVPDQCFSEFLLWLVTRPSDNFDNDDDDPALGVIWHLLAPLVNYAPLETRSAHLQGHHTISLPYGPDLMRQPTTRSSEIVQCLRDSGLDRTLRLEVGRHLSCQTRRFVADRVPPGTLAALTLGTLVEYDVRVQRQLPVTLQSTAWRPLPERDPICAAVMLPLQRNILPLAVQASNGNSYTVSRYAVMARRSYSCVFQRLPCENVTHIADSFTHLHSAIQTGAGALQNILFHATLLPGGEIRSALCGFYATTPSVGAFSRARHRAINTTATLHCQQLARTGTPVLGGFLKTVHSATTSEANVITTTSLLSCVPQAYTFLRRSLFSQPIICLGSFEPVDGDGNQRSLYLGSAAGITRITQTLSLAYEILEGPLFTSINRAHEPASVIGHLGALVSRGGLRLFVSQLPPTILSQLTATPDISRETVNDILVNKFLNVSACVVFAVLPRDTEPEPGPLDAIRRAARICGCPFAVVGETCEELGIQFVNDLELWNPGAWPIRQPTSAEVIATFGFDEQPVSSNWLVRPEEPEDGGEQAPSPTDWGLFRLASVVDQLLRCPTVGSKEFVTRHVDRCSNGLVAQQCEVGPLGRPLSDYHIVNHTSVFTDRMARVPIYRPQPITRQDATERLVSPETWVTQGRGRNRWVGQCVAYGEQAYKMGINAAVGARYAICEAVTNIMLAHVRRLSDITLTASVGWNPEDDQAWLLQHTLFACKELCRDLSINFAITSAGSTPCLSEELISATQQHQTVAPVPFNAVVITATAEVKSSRQRVTPDLKATGNLIVLVSFPVPHLTQGSTFEHLCLLPSPTLPDVQATHLANLFMLTEALLSRGLVVSGHDVSDGGMVVTAIEMALAGNRGLQIRIPSEETPLQWLVSETPGVIFEIQSQHVDEVRQACQNFDCRATVCGTVGQEGLSERIVISHNNDEVYSQTLTSVAANWTSFSDEQWYSWGPSFTPAQELYRKDYGCNQHNLGHLAEVCRNSELTLFATPSRPPAVAALVTPGAPLPRALMAAFTNVGFDVAAVSTDDLRGGNILRGFSGLTIGGTVGIEDSYVGARCAIMGLLNDPGCYGGLMAFFRRADTFSLCCGEFGFQLLGALGLLRETPHDTPGPKTPDQWDIHLEENASGNHECLWLNLHIPQTTISIMFRVLRGLVLPGWANGRYLGVRYPRDAMEYHLNQQQRIALNYHTGNADPRMFAQHYPRNPSANSAVAAITSPDGRHLASLVDPAVTFHPWQWAYVPPELADMTVSPWALAFQSLFLWCIRNRQ